jgi:DNA-binding MarR family transcriptional regulator
MAATDLNADDHSVLGALMLADIDMTARTADKLADLAGLSESQTAKTLRKLEGMDPPLVQRDTDATLGREVWIALSAAGDAVDGES